ncbi:hypothetical protein DPMN_057002 [Dreissena polymorpha]|uniref:Uncharacterized protein n=1 Tax=Dreissena polymorpha TaxID=45954 RepID=A0A9D4CSR6_DREPO|nr:hypothetical protein DPMN_057002 [Dreissena polymorpha]
MPLLRSDHNCKHEIDTRNGHMKTASCQETHIFRPFSNSDSGVVTITTQTLSYVGRTTGTKSPCKRRI